MTGPPGAFTVGVEVPEGWAVKSLSLGGFDASDDLAIDIGGEQNVPITVVLTDRMTEVSGTVADAGPSGAHVVVFPADSGQWTPRRIRRAQADSRGRYRIMGLPPANGYKAVAVAELEEGQEGDPEFLRQIQSDASAFDLDVDEKQIVNLKILQQ